MDSQICTGDSSGRNKDRESSPAVVVGLTAGNCVPYKDDEDKCFYCLYCGKIWRRDW